MSLRVIIQPDLITRWITERGGTPARKHGTDAELRILFHEANREFEPLPLADFLEAMKFNHLVLLVEEEAGDSFHRFVARG